MEGFVGLVDVLFRGRGKMISRHLLLKFFFLHRISCCCKAKNVTYACNELLIEECQCPFPPLCDTSQ